MWRPVSCSGILQRVFFVNSSREPKKNGALPQFLPCFFFFGGGVWLSCLLMVNLKAPTTQNPRPNPETLALKLETLPKPPLYLSLKNHLEPNLNPLTPNPRPLPKMNPPCKP